MADEISKSISLENEIINILRWQSCSEDIAWYDLAEKFVGEHFKLPKAKQGFVAETVEADGVTPAGWFNPGTRKKTLRMLRLPSDFFTGSKKAPDSDEVLKEVEAFFGMPRAYQEALISRFMAEEEDTNAIS